MSAIPNVSLHQKIIGDIEESIRAGIWKPGERIPYEQALTETYGCSRMTVSKALSALADRGMIIRKRRAGSFVAPPTQDLTVLQIQDIGSDVQRAGHRYSYHMLSRQTDCLSEAEAMQLGEPAGEAVLRLECLHIVDDTPHALEQRLILLRSVPQVAFEPFATKSPGAWLLDQIPWSEAKHIIRAVPANAKAAKALKVPKGSACLVLTRQTWQHERTVTYVEITHAGERYQFAGIFRPTRNTTATAATMQRETGSG